MGYTSDSMHGCTEAVTSGDGGAQTGTRTTGLTCLTRHTDALTCLTRCMDTQRQSLVEAEVHELELVRMNSHV